MPIDMPKLQPLIQSRFQGIKGGLLSVFEHLLYTAEQRGNTFYKKRGSPDFYNYTESLRERVYIDILSGSRYYTNEFELNYKSIWY
jgi:hypothetical protein